MSELTSPQRRAASDALRLLRRANVPLETILRLASESFSDSTEESDLDDQPGPSPAIQKASYVPPKATYFSDDERAMLCHKVTSRSFVSAIVDHPEGSVVEYPEAGTTAGTAIAHRFEIDPSIPNSDKIPKDNIQFSLGDSHGGRNDVKCYLLHNSVTNEHIFCKKRTYGCRSTKACEFVPQNQHHAVSNPSALDYRQPWSAKREVFTHTLALYTALQEKGCAFARDEFSPREVESSSESESTASTSSDSMTCKGRLILTKSTAGQYIIQCEYRRKGRRSHLRITDLHPYNISYLSALFSNNKERISEIEEEAKKEGYGPLAPCNFMVPASAKKQLCPEWHRFPDGALSRGELRPYKKCNVLFDIFTPNEINDQQSQILIVCRNAHTHPLPAPTSTPPVYVSIFQSMLLKLGWKLADATPRRVLLNSSFIAALREQLGWPHECNPVLGNLHPSFTNNDHVKRLILEMRETYFPFGTGFAGVQDLCRQETLLEEKYVRIVEEVNVDGQSFRIVICMTPIMSQYLINAKRLTIDTSFKRVYGMDEFEVETWHDNGKKSMVTCRAFTTSQSAVAHRELFKRIFQVAEGDTGLPVRFRHIHGEGIESFVADGHKGQGLGMYCEWLCRDNHGFCSDEPGRILSTLDPCDHLLRIYRYCTVHFKRNVIPFKKSVSKEVYAAMLSLATTERIENLEAKFALIRSGGKATSDWLDDKLVSTRFAFASLYWHASKMPLEIWKACPSTTNGNEQAHRNVNRDGVGLTLLAGVMRGKHYDKRAFEGIESIATTGVLVQDGIATHHNRKVRSVVRKVNSQRRRVASVDEQLQKLNNKIYQLKQSIVKSTIQQRKELLKGKSSTSTSSRLRKLREELVKVRAAAEKIQGDGSGKIAVDTDEIEHPMEVDGPVAALSKNNPHDVQRLTPAQPSLANVPYHASNLIASTNLQHTSGSAPSAIDARSVVPDRFRAFVPNLKKWYGQ